MCQSSNVTVTLCTDLSHSLECKGSCALLASPNICSHSIKALSIPNVISPSACYCAAAVVYTGLRKEPCEPGGNCVKSPCELSVRWLADRWVCRPAAKAGREEDREGGREGEGGGGSMERRKDLVLKASGQGAGRLSLHVRGRLLSCREERCLQNERGQMGVVLWGNGTFPI